MTLYGFTDGAARGNPGHGGIGVILKDKNGKVIAREKRYLGKVTNNVAEYSALLACLHKVEGLLTAHEAISCSRLVVHSDSELMVRQINGEYKVKDKTLKEFFARVQSLLHDARFEFIIKHIPRAQNREADALANESIDEHVR